MICSKCHIDKDISEFFKKKESKKGYHSWCSDCMKEGHRNLTRNWKASGRCFRCGSPDVPTGQITCLACRKLTIERLHRNKLKAIGYLGGRCKMCGLDTEYISIYDFHHRNPQEKEHNTGRLMSRSWKVIKRELDKCDLVCSNCHRIIHEIEDRGEV